MSQPAQKGEAAQKPKCRVGVTDIQWDAPDQAEISGETVRIFPTCPGQQLDPLQEDLPRLCLRRV